MRNNTLILYIHGKGGTAEEAERYKPLFPNCDVAGLDYKAKTPWEAKAEFPAAFQRFAAEYDRVILIANSIGAYFAMCALPQEKIEKAYFISPIVNMDKLICNMMRWANVSEDELRKKGTIETTFGETLSWEYLSYVRAHPLDWTAPTEIIYGGLDDMTDETTITDFSDAHSAKLTVMADGEHWFRTPRQLAFLDAWLVSKLITTEHLLLRPWHTSDASDLYEYAKDPAVGPIAGWHPHGSIEESLGIIQEILNGTECYAICKKESNRAIGCIELRLNGHTDMTDRDDECELGYWLGKPFWGKGYMTEAASAILCRAFENLKMTKVWYGYYDGNERSKRVQEKLGFVYHHTCNNVFVPLLNEHRIGHTNVMTNEDRIFKRSARREGRFK